MKKLLKHRAQTISNSFTCNSFSFSYLYEELNLSYCFRFAYAFMATKYRKGTVDTCTDLLVQ